MATTKATHAPNVTINVTLAATPVQEAGFGVVLLLVPLATNSLNGVRVVEYTTYEDAQTANTAGYISSGTLAAVETLFAQRPKPASVKVGYVDLASGTPETYATGLAACIAFDSAFYGVCCTSRVDTDIVLVSDAVEASSKRMLFYFQDSDASWLDAGVPTNFAAIDDNERTAGVYHTTDAEWGDVAAIGNRLAYDPDEKSVPWHYYGPRGVEDYSTVPTAAQRLLAIANNINLGMGFGGDSYVMDPGVTLTGRPIDEIVTMDWFAVRLDERIQALALDHGNRGEKITVDAQGQALVVGVIEGLLQQGIAAGHFAAGLDENDDPTTSVVAETITSADRTARRFRITVRAQIAISGRLFTINAYFSRDPIQGA